MVGLRRRGLGMGPAPTCASPPPLQYRRAFPCSPLKFGRHSSDITHGTTRRRRGTMARTRTTQAVRRQMTRARLLEAAFSVFAAQGYTGATIDAIVHTAGYSKGAFYFHFSSKEEVFLEVLWSRARIEEQNLRSAGEGAAGRPLELLRGVAAYLGPGAEDPLWPALLLE